MPASPLPLIITLMSVVMLIAGLPTVRQQHANRARLLVAAGVLGLLLPPTVLLSVLSTLRWQAARGSVSAQLQYARWIESTPDIMMSVSLIPYDFHFDLSWSWLEKAASGGSVEAKYAIGNRIKYDLFVPKDAVEGRNGQEMMDEAIADGFVLRVPERQYYFGQFRVQTPIRL
jgi:hypothetical protein